MGQVVERLQAWGAERVEENRGKPERATFGLSNNLVDALAGSER